MGVIGPGIPLLRIWECLNLFLVILKQVCQKYLKMLLPADVNVTFKGCHGQDQFLFNSNPNSLLQINTVLSYHCGFMEAIISNRNSCFLFTCPLDWTSLRPIWFLLQSPLNNTALRDHYLLLLRKQYQCHSYTAFIFCAICKICKQFLEANILF